MITFQLYPIHINFLCTPVNKYYKKFYKKLDTYLQQYYTYLHIQIHYFFFVTKKIENSDSFNGKNILEFCHFCYKLKYNEFEDKSSQVGIILLEVHGQIFIEFSVIFVSWCAREPCMHKIYFLQTISILIFMLGQHFFSKTNLKRKRVSVQLLLHITQSILK